MICIKNIFSGLLWTLIIATSAPDSNGQITDPLYETTLKALYSNTVPLISCEDLAQLGARVVLDTREKGEYNVSHLKDGLWVGYETFTKKKVAKLPKDTAIVVYCSVGKRSEDIGVRLLELGYTKVMNLHGGIFEWVNQGYPVYDKEDLATKNVHGYSKIWSVWLRKGNVVYK